MKSSPCAYEILKLWSQLKYVCGDIQKLLVTLSSNVTRDIHKLLVTLSSNVTRDIHKLLVTLSSNVTRDIHKLLVTLSSNVTANCNGILDTRYPSHITTAAKILQKKLICCRTFHVRVCPSRLPFQVPGAATAHGQWAEQVQPSSFQRHRSGSRVFFRPILSVERKGQAVEWKVRHETIHRSPPIRDFVFQATVANDISIVQGYSSTEAKTKEAGVGRPRIVQREYSGDARSS